MLSNWFMSPPDDLDPDAHALAIRVGEEAAYYVVPSHFPDGPPPVDRLREWVSDWRRGAGVELVDVTTADEWATIEMLLTPESLAERDNPTALDPPLVTWSVDVDDRTVTIRHEAGGSLPVDGLSVDDVDDTDVTFSSDDCLGPGDTITVHLSGTSDVTDVLVRYTSEDGDRSVALFSHELSASDTDETEQGE